MEKRVWKKYRRVKDHPLGSYKAGDVLIGYQRKPDHSRVVWCQKGYSHGLRNLEEIKGEDFKVGDKVIVEGQQTYEIIGVTEDYLWVGNEATPFTVNKRVVKKTPEEPKEVYVISGGSTLHKAREDVELVRDMHHPGKEILTYVLKDPEEQW